MYACMYKGNRESIETQAVVAKTEMFNLMKY